MFGTLAGSRPSKACRSGGTRALVRLPSPLGSRPGHSSTPGHRVDLDAFTNGGVGRSSAELVATAGGQR